MLILLLFKVDLLLKNHSISRDFAAVLEIAQQMMGVFYVNLILCFILLFLVTFIFKISGIFSHSNVENATAKLRYFWNVDSENK